MKLGFVMWLGSVGILKGCVYKPYRPSACVPGLRP